MTRAEVELAFGLISVGVGLVAPPAGVVLGLIPAAWALLERRYEDLCYELLFAGLPFIGSILKAAKGFINVIPALEKVRDLSKISFGIKSLIAAIKGFFNDMLNAAKAYINRAGKEAIALAKKAGRKLMDWGKRAKDELIDWANEVGSNISQTGSNIVDWGKQTGSDIVDWAKSTPINTTKPGRIFGDLLYASWSGKRDLAEWAIEGITNAVTGIKEELNKTLF